MNRALDEWPITPEAEIFAACDALLEEFAGSERQFTNVMELLTAWMDYPSALPKERQNQFGNWSKPDFEIALDYVQGKFDAGLSGSMRINDL